MLTTRQRARAPRNSTLVRRTSSRRARRIEVAPSFQCSDWKSDLTQADAELMLAAARENVPANTVYLGRYTYGVTLRDVLREPSQGEEMLAAQRDVYCKQEIERARSGGRRGYIFVLLSDEPRPEDRRDGSGASAARLSPGHDIARGLTKVVCGPLDHRIRARKSNVIRHAVEVMAEAR